MTHWEDSPRLFEYTGRAAADGQLQTAITLYFEEKDRASIHTLAIAAQGLLNQMCKDRHIKESEIHKLVQAQSRKIREAFRAPQNFFKHGRYTGQKGGTVRNAEMWTEMILVDCLSMHQRLFGTLSPMMLLYAFRYSLFNPRAFPAKITVKGIKIEDLKRFTRSEFLEKVFPRLRGEVWNSQPLQGTPPASP